MKDTTAISVLLVDGGDRQTIAMARAYKKLGFTVTTLNDSKLDIGYASRYPDKKLLYPGSRSDINIRIKAMKECILSGEYDVVITTSDDTAEALSLIKDNCSDKAQIAVVDPGLFYMAYDKNKTMKVCMDNNIPCPITIFGIEKTEDIPFGSIVFPVVVKPCMSYGAIGYHRIDNERELRNLCESIGTELKNYVIQEYIPQTDIQYECAMFIDQNNQVKASCVFSKNRWFPVSGGSSTCNVTVDRPDIVESCTKLLQTIGWRGAADIDLIQDPRDGKAKIMEINPRVSGSVKVVLNAGVNIAEQIVQLALNAEVSDYRTYKIDTRLRCLHTDLLWFIKSPNRFKSKPSWFSWRHTTDQVWMLSDPLPFFTFSIQAISKYRKEMEKRK
ncbi:MAG: ATP-grasp domain-containing protein [Clostridia bacterium]|nr:ATP-grasp domain-containing protein [Clostridia bacterium]